MPHASKPVYPVTCLHAGAPPSLSGLPVAHLRGAAAPAGGAPAAVLGVLLG